VNAFGLENIEVLGFSLVSHYSGQINQKPMGGQVNGQLIELYIN